MKSSCYGVKTKVKNLILCMVKSPEQELILEEGRGVGFSGRWLVAAAGGH